MTSKGHVLVPKTTGLIGTAISTALRDSNWAVTALHAPLNTSGLVAARWDS
jgi:hypothetical protein